MNYSQMIKSGIGKNTTALLSLTLLLIATSADALVSVKLNDVIKSSGSGDIDLFTPFDNKHTIDGSVLEQLRLDNSGDLVFAVDINEAANGSEKASTQGVAIESAELVIVISGVEYRYDQFSTRTNSMLAKKGSTQRSLYPTLLGDSGSNRITSNTDSDLYGSSFDSTLNFPVAEVLTLASSARLLITFLDSNVSLGDPEAFYDFSNGFEDVAIITAEDASYLDDLDSGLVGAPLVLPEDTIVTPDGGTAYYPSLTSYYIAAYEDLFPYRGDYDFNDLVVGYRVAANLDTDGNVSGISAEGYLIARGAGYNHDWHLRIPLPASSSGSGVLNLYLPGELASVSGYPLPINSVGDLDVIAFPTTRQLWLDAPHEGVNTLDAQTLIQGHRFSFSITLDTPVALSYLDDAPFDPYLYVRDTRYEIHLEGKASVHPDSRNIAEGQTSFVDNNNYPFAQIFPEDWQVPVERKDLGEAYPEFINFVLSGRSSNIKWYDAPVTAKVKPLHPSLWKW